MDIAGSVRYDDTTGTTAPRTGHDMTTYNLERNLQYGSDWEIILENATEREIEVEKLHQKMKFPHARFRVVECPIKTPTT